MFTIYSEYFTKDDSNLIVEPDWKYSFFDFLTVELQEKLFKKISEMTWSQKNFYLGLQYEFGIRVEKNYVKALKFYIKGFYQRNSYSCYRLYFLYRKDNSEFNIKKNRDLAILYLLISAAYYEFMPINHKFDPKLYFATNLDLEDYDKQKTLAILDSLKYSPITESEVIFLRCWLNIYFNKNLDELLDHIAILESSIQNFPYDHSLLLLANLYFDPIENSISKNIEKADFHFSKLENSNDPVVLICLGKYYSTNNQYQKALNFFYKALVMGFCSYNAYINCLLCYKSSINYENFDLYLKFFVNNLILGDCNILADLIAFLKYLKMIKKHKEKILELNDLEKYYEGIINIKSSWKENLNKEIKVLENLYNKYSKYFFSFIHLNEDVIKLNNCLSINYLINIPFFLMNSYTKGSNGSVDLNKVSSIANNTELTSKLNERHKNYLLMLEAKNLNRKKDVVKFYEKYKELTKSTYQSNYLQCYTLFKFEYFLKNVKNANHYLEIINSKNCLNSEYMYSNIETFYIQEKGKILTADKISENSKISENKNENKINNDHTHNEMKNLCVICMENEKVVIFIPCGHRCTCESCGDKIFSFKKVCPICKLKIEFKISKVYD